MKKITDRLHRIQGQIASIETSIENEVVCSDVIPQLLAVKGAVHAVVQVYLEDALENCIDEADTEKLKKVIKTFIKNS